ncbi:MAG: hypothetical protein KAV25_07510 [Methanophagales archaeon]|nr:hypothetical protein [Methanophagales archaeon]
MSEAVPAGKGKVGIEGLVASSAEEFYMSRAFMKGGWARKTLLGGLSTSKSVSQSLKIDRTINELMQHQITEIAKNSQKMSPVHAPSDT